MVTLFFWEGQFNKYLNNKLIDKKKSIWNIKINQVTHFKNLVYIIE